MWASEYKYQEVVRRLLARGANPHLRDKEQNTALHWAAFSGSADTISQLLHAKCEIDALNERGERQGGSGRLSRYPQTERGIILSLDESRVKDGCLAF